MRDIIIITCGTSGLGLELVKQSMKKDFNLLITKMKLGEEEIGFCLRFTVPETKRNNTDLNDFKQSSTKLIMYDILKLNFVRTHLVTQKKNPNEEYFSQLKNMTPTITTVDANTEVVHKKGKKNKNKKKNNNNNSGDEEEEDK